MSYCKGLKGKYSGEGNETVFIIQVEKTLRGSSDECRLVRRMLPYKYLEEEYSKAEGLQVQRPQGRNMLGLKQEGRGTGLYAVHHACAAVSIQGKTENSGDHSLGTRLTESKRQRQMLVE